MRIRLVFSKLEPMRYTGHLDLFSTWERTIRRAGLPLAYSQGFNPRPRLNLASALPLGFISSGEVMDIWLEDDLPLDMINNTIKGALPPGLGIIKINEVTTNEPSLQSQLASAEYKITFLNSLTDLDVCIEEILAKDCILRERRGKSYDLRPLIISAQRLPDDEEGRNQLYLRLSAREGATGRPEEVLLAIGADPTFTRIERIGLIFQDK